MLHKRSGRSHSDEGVYQCLAHNSIGAFISANATVSVASKNFKKEIQFKFKFAKKNKFPKFQIFTKKEKKFKFAKKVKKN